MNILEVMKHRYPFIMVDKVLETEYMKCAKVIKNVSYNEPWVQGHYPEHPIMPGVLLIEAMGQASGFMFVEEGSKNNKYYGYLVKINQVKFIKPVHPGDQLVIESKMVDSVGNYVIVDSKVMVDNKVFASCNLSYILKEENDEL